MAKLVRTSDLKPHPRLGGTDLLPTLSDEEYGALLQSIDRDGIQQPLLVGWPDRTILDGHHRWRAAMELGLPEVPIMTEEFRGEEERLKLGVTLNVARRQLSNEQKRAAIAAVLKADPKQSDRAVAEAVGASPTFVGKTRSELESAGLVSTVDTRVGRDGVTQPATKPARPRAAKAPSSWKPERQAEGDRLIGSLPEEERAAAAALVSEDFIPEQVGIELLKNVAEMAPEERREVLRLHQSEDPRDRSLAKTRAAKQPPNPDPRCTILHAAQLHVGRALRWCDRDRDEGFRQRIENVMAELERLSEDIHQASRSSAA